MLFQHLMFLILCTLNTLMTGWLALSVYVSTLYTEHQYQELVSIFAKICTRLPMAS